MRYSILFIFFSILLISNLASASQYNIEISQVDNKLLVKHSILLDKNEEISIIIPSDASAISSNIAYSVNDNKLIFEGRNIELSYITHLALEKSERGYYFIDNIIFPSEFNNVNVKLILKEGYFLDNDKIFPEHSIIETDGRQITIVWDYNNVIKNSDMPIFVSIEHSSNNISFWLIVSIILIGLIIYLYKNYFPHNRKSKEIDSHLIDSEKIILRIIKESDRGEIWQKQLQLKTNFSKAKLSRMIRNLESRNLIEKIPFGNTNKIRLK